MAYYGGGAGRGGGIRALSHGGRTADSLHRFNEVGPPEAWATDTEAGAARLSKPLLEEKLREATAGAPIVFAMVQCTNENEPVPWPSQVRLFHRAVDLGATITGSSSAHRAMGLEFYRGRLIIYGLGNFLFDQMQTVHHRRGMIARHHSRRAPRPDGAHPLHHPRLLPSAPAAGRARARAYGRGVPLQPRTGVRLIGAAARDHKVRLGGDEAVPAGEGKRPRRALFDGPVKVGLKAPFEHLEHAVPSVERYLPLLFAEILIGDGGVVLHHAAAPLEDDGAKRLKIVVAEQIRGGLHEGRRGALVPEEGGEFRLVPQRIVGNVDAQVERALNG